MKSNKSYLTLILVLIFVFGSSLLFGQVTMTVNSLADDEYSYPWDDSNTTLDESRDGICRDELGRCTLRAAIEEANNMSVPLLLTFGVSGTIDLIDVLNIPDQSRLRGEGKIELKGELCFEINYNNMISGFKFNNSLEAILVVGESNSIGTFEAGNTFINCYIALNIEGDNNVVMGNYFGLDADKVLGPNQVGILVTGANNQIGTISDYGNTICASTIAGISIMIGGGNNLRNNYIGTTADGDVGYGNAQGIIIQGSDFNWIGNLDDFSGQNVISGNTTEGIAIFGVPPDSYSTSNLVAHNIIGLNPSQSSALPNGNGVVISNGAKLDRIYGNIIAGNSLSGIHIFGYDEESKPQMHDIFDNRIGINSIGKIIPNGQNGINIWGNVESVIIGRGLVGNFTPNLIIGNNGRGIFVSDQFGYSPSKILIRRNLIYQNKITNLYVSPQSNNGILPPYDLSLVDNYIDGFHEIPNAVIDVYKSDLNESHLSAYEWLGSTTTDANGIFSFEITDPAIESFSLTATSGTGNTSEFASLDLTTGIEDENDKIPTEFSLNQNYPNPFNPSTTISYQLPTNAQVTLKVYNVLGDEVASLINEEKLEGSYLVNFNAAQLSSGIYFYQIKAGSFYETKKMILMK